MQIHDVEFAVVTSLVVVVEVVDDLEAVGDGDLLKRYLEVSILGVVAKYVLETVLLWLRLFLNSLSRCHHLLYHHLYY